MEKGDRYKYKRELAEKLKVLSPETHDRTFIVLRVTSHHVELMMENGYRSFLEEKACFAEMFEEIKDGTKEVL